MSTPRLPSSPRSSQPVIYAEIDDVACNHFEASVPLDDVQPTLPSTMMLIPPVYPHFTYTPSRTSGYDPSTHHDPTRTADHAKSSEISTLHRTSPNHLSFTEIHPTPNTIYRLRTAPLLNTTTFYETANTRSLTTTSQTSSLISPDSTSECTTASLRLNDWLEELVTRPRYNRTPRRHSDCDCVPVNRSQNCHCGRTTEF